MLGESIACVFREERVASALLLKLPDIVLHSQKKPTEWFVKEKGNFVPKVLMKEQWKEHCRKGGKLEEKEPNVQANIYLLTLHVLPVMVSTCKRWGANKTKRHLSAVTHVCSEAWVFQLASEGHFDTTKTGKKHMSTQKDCEQFVKTVEWLKEARGGQQGGVEWDETTRKMAERCKEKDEEANERALEERRQKKWARLTDEERKALNDAKKGWKKQRLIMPHFDQVPLPAVMMEPTNASTVLHSSMSKLTVTGANSAAV